ncbi:glycosyltransferase family 4 protein [Aliiglaciecola sp. LCG003]|uniref:glycosyltransferase family 4 protein n=1 Tax=Aliiglaciecola sp. LCG003 TaxID=3053655 RepID=UPI002573EAD6|nr:glycosyltransferase family 4 protein [Aliiglaciecola sp. LCG003]WJG10407.1 glycosyltransferase family 4 protein [Aliiglaciecola sp. LCG003]
MKNKKIYFVVNQGAFFVSHRLELAKRAKELGWQVKVLFGNSGGDVMELPAIKKLNELDIPFAKLKFNPIGKNVIFELIGFLQLFYILVKDKPDLVHTVTPKGMIYGGLAARLAGIKCLVLAVSGMGYLYTSKGGALKRALVWAIDKVTAFILSHKNKVIIVQNSYDFNYFSNKKGVAPESVKIIQGSGVHLEKYNHILEEGKRVVVFPARLLVDKGLCEFVDAARLLRNKGITWRFVLVGSAGAANPTSVSPEAVNRWVNEGVVEWYGHVQDMAAIYEECDIVCLPSYREGMPKTLLEAAAAGRAVVTTDTVGCNEAIVDHVTGLLVPVKNTEKLADAIETLINNKELRISFGRNGRLMAQEKYSIENVVNTTYDIYAGLFYKVRPKCNTIL